MAYPEEALATDAVDTRPRVAVAASTIERSLENLVKVVMILEDRLVSVLRPENPSPTVGEGLTEVARPKSPLAGDLERCAELVDRQAIRLGVLIDRLET